MYKESQCISAALIYTTFTPLQFYLIININLLYGARIPSFPYIARSVNELWIKNSNRRSLAWNNFSKRTAYGPCIRINVEWILIFINNLYESIITIWCSFFENFTLSFLVNCFWCDYHQILLRKRFCKLRDSFLQKDKLFSKAHKITLAEIQGDHELKRGIKKKLTKVCRNGVSKFIGIKKILFTIQGMLRTLISKLNLAFSYIFHSIFQLKSKANITSTTGLHIRSRLKRRKQTLIVLAISTFFVFNLFLLTSIGGQMFYQTSLQSYGSIETLGVAAYKDSLCTSPTSDINWGTISPGASLTNTVYLRNEGNSDVTLSLETVNWSPTNAPTYMTLSWNYAGQKISPNQVIYIRLTLSVSQNVTGINNFNFDILMIGNA